ncbi:MAG: aminotransferase class III-fold pyridoxal phosphate-dependent enzyme [bacterium]|nr:aminotransferase class III-fold pyridoxal phosphate-dependent enzyme [bacterium]
MAAVAACVCIHTEEYAAYLRRSFPNFRSYLTIPPRDGYLKFLREQTDKYGIVLIFDEIVNFWLDHGGTGSLFDVEPDLCVYGKGIGGGLPMGLVGGHSDIMKLFRNLPTTLRHLGS